MKHSRTSEKHSPGSAERLGRWLVSKNTRFGALALFVALVFLMGGSSRPDTLSLVFLRPLAVAFGAYALIVMRPAEWQAIKFPVILLGLLALTMVLQLIPLPPEIWTSLPKREPIAQIGAAMGLDQAWRPLSLAPERTINALASLVVPAAALFLFAVQLRENRRPVIMVLICMAIASSVLGIAQLSASPDGPLYTYRITNNGNAVGLLANRNHQAVFLAVMVYVAGWFAVTEMRRDHRTPIRLSLSAAAIIFGIVLVLVIGSRSGLIALLLSGAAACWFIMRSDAGQRLKRMGRLYQGLLAGIGFLVAGLVAFVVFQSRSLSLSRLFDSIGDESTADLRSSLFPIMWDMITQLWPFGSGFGAFEDTFRLFEPVEILTPRYVNQAHNDWAQFVIEGGLAGFAIMAAFIAWFVRRTMQARAMPAANAHRERSIMALTVLFVLGLASIVDYPLRTPALAAFAALLIAMIECSACGNRETPE